MQVKPKCLISLERTELFMQENGPHPVSGRTIIRNLLFLCIALVFSMPSTSGTWASEQQNIESYENIDTRWLPLIGSWRLVSNTINTVETVLKEDYLLTIRSEGKGELITMESSRDKTVMFEEKIEADGSRRFLNTDGCTGWYSYSWSENGSRLLFNGESSCDDNLSQKISGISIIDTIGDLVDIKLLKSGEDKAITIRRYRNIENGFITPVPTIPTTAVAARISAGTNFSIDEIIKLSGIVEPEVLGAALAEMRSPFPVNSKQLMRLSDAKVPSQVVDLMVALSFPKNFTVGQTSQSWVEISSSLRAPYYHLPMCPWYWTSSTYSLYGYRYWGWDWYRQFGWFPHSYGYIPYCGGFNTGYAYSPYGYQYWGWDWYQQFGWFPYIYGHVPPYSGGSSSSSSTTLVAGQGYTRVYTSNSSSTKRYAQPRVAQSAKGTTSQSSSSSSAGSSSSVTSSGSSVGSTYSSPSASPSGYSSGARR